MIYSEETNVCEKKNYLEKTSPLGFMIVRKKTSASVSVIKLGSRSDSWTVLESVSSEGKIAKKGNHSSRPIADLGASAF